MRFSFSSHKELSSVDKVFSALSNLEYLEGKDIVKILEEYYTYPCFRKISNADFFSFLQSEGKVTRKFLAFYESLYFISRRKMLNVKNLFDFIKSKKVDETESRKILKYILSLYIYKDEEARKELFFICWNKNKTNSMKNYKEAEYIVADSTTKDYIFFKDNEMEDGKLPEKKLTVSPFEFKDIVLDADKQESLIQMFEDQIVMLDDESTIKVLKNIAEVIGLNIITD